jgi:peptidoglycan/xylan/chitin deacetylase (PgdA/CDA1 family)
VENSGANRVPEVRRQRVGCFTIQSFLSRGYSLRIAVQARTTDVGVIRELLSPWDFSFTSLDEAEVVIVYTEKPLETKETVVVPSDSVDFMTWIKNLKLKVVRKLGEPVSTAVSPQTVLTITPQTLYCYDGLVKSVSKDTPPTTAELNEDLIFLTLDIVREYNKILDDTLNAKPSTAYRLVTGLPIHYSLAPKRLRDLFMKQRSGQEDIAFCEKLPLDALRFILVRAIERLSGKEPRRKNWNGKGYACTMTHDVDTRNGLQKARVVKKLEEKYDVPSAWYIPTKHYELNHEIVEELANYGEVGAHDTKHDGKLVQLPKQKLVRRLREVKYTLEKIINCSVEGFRAPLLQHNVDIIRALEDAGYTYDTSIPTWEPKHPYNMKPHGVGSANPLKISEIVEIPVSLPQDHQMLNVLGLTPEQTVDVWMKLKESIRDIGGVCTILVHPSYELTHFNNMKTYEDLINDFATDDDAWVTLPTQIANRCSNS